MEITQINVRAPEASRDALHAVAAKLRADPDFLRELQAFAQPQQKRRGLIARLINRGGAA